MDGKDDMIKAFFDACMRMWERKHGRKPRTMEEMWDAVADGVEPCKRKNQREKE